MDKAPKTGYSAYYSYLNMPFSRSLRVFSYVFVLVIGIGGGAALCWWYDRLVTQPSALVTPGGQMKRLGKTDLINPLLECEVFNEDQVPRLKSIKEDIENLIAKEKQNPAVSEISVYFRGLNRGRWFGIHETDPYVGASLIKIPILLAFYKGAEDNPALLDIQVEFTQRIRDIALPQNILPKDRMVVGNSYSVSELLRRMTVESDNEAMNLLVSHVPRTFIDRVFTDLNLPLQRNGQQDVIISPATLSTFFRVLYNGSYLSHQASNEILTMLTKTDFVDGIKAGTPTGIEVADKFGERISKNAQGQLNYAELHDCGIIYHPTNPYFLCVMTKGTLLDALKAPIQHVSAMVYKEMDALWKSEQVKTP